MKKQLGISVYPEQQDENDIIKYIDLAAKYNFTRLFTSLLQVTKENKKEAVAKMKHICQYASSKGFEVILDVAPYVFDILGIKLPDVSFFEKMGASTIRLDNHYDGVTEKEIYVKSNLNVEINMSSFMSIGSLLDELKVDKNRVVASYNFYPQRYSGLDFDYFLKTSKHYKKLGFRTSAFVTSQSKKATWGPWPINEGLCTLEMHRDLPIVTQAKHLFATQLIDDVVIGNACASEEELKALSVLNKDTLEINVQTLNKPSKIEEKILFEYDSHFRRGDINEYMVRSTMTRVIYKDESFKPLVPKTKKSQLPGEIYIGNDKFKNYKGEMHLILKEMPYDPKKNLVGKIVDEEKFLIKYIDSWTSFKLKKSNKNN